VDGTTPVTNDELVSATLDGSLLNGQLLAKLLNTALQLGLNLLGSGTVTRDVNGEVGLWHEGGGLAAGSLGRRLGTPGVVLRDLDVDVSALGEVLGVDVVRASEERIKLGWDVLQTEVDSRGALVDDGVNLATSHLSSQGIALDVDIDNSIIVLARLSLLDIDASTGALADFLDLGTLTTDDVGANGGGNGDIDRLLLQVSFAFDKLQKRLALDPTSLATSLRA
jgi:hypothetical protein